MPAIPRWSVGEYEQMVESGLVPKRAELIRGIIIERPPRTPMHMYLTHWLYDQFYKHLLPDHAVYQLAPLRLADSEPEPDITVIQDSGAKFRAQHQTTALLAVRIITESTAIDREYSSLCAEVNIPEYWVVIAESKQVEVRRQPLKNEYREQQTYGVNDTLVSLSVPELTVVLTELFR